MTSTLWLACEQFDTALRIAPATFFSKAWYKASLLKKARVLKVSMPVRKPHTNSSLVGPSTLTARMRSWRLASRAKSDSSASSAP